MKASDESIQRKDRGKVTLSVRFSIQSWVFKRVVWKGNFITIGLCWPGVHRLVIKQDIVHRLTNLQNFWENYFFSENYATVPSRREFGFKNKNSGVFPPVKKVPKAIFYRNGQTSGITSVQEIETIAENMA